MSDKQLRWGLVSTARINERLIPPINESPRSVLLAVGSRDKAKGESYAQKWNIPRAYASYEELLADPDVDVVYISLPNHLHVEWAVKSAEAGKHILCEKPLALTVAEVDRMTQAAQHNGVVLQEAAMYRYHPQTQKVKELVTQGAIGDVRFIRFVFSFTLTNQGDIRLEPDMGGGSLWDIGSYPVSFARTMMQSDPVEVVGWQIATEKGVDMTFAGQMHFANGAVAQFGSSFQAIPYWDAEIFGSTGSIHMDHPWMNVVGNPGHVRVVSGGAAEKGKATFGDSMDHLKQEVLTFEGNAYLYEVQGMENSALDGASPVISLASSRGNIATLVALYTSAREGRMVKL